MSDGGAGTAGDIFSMPNNKVTDANIRSAAVINGVIGGLFIVLFALIQTKSILYKIRLVSPTVTVKPPPLPVGVHALWQWLHATLMTSDAELLQSAGLDALMLVKTMTLSIQLFVPIAFIGLVILLPIHSKSTYLESDPSYGNQAQFMRLTTTNIEPGAKVLWLHAVLTILYIVWGCWLIKWHIHQFTIIRQKYLQAGDDVNVWRALFDETNQAERAKPKFSDVLGNLKQLTMVNALSKLAGGKAAAPADSPQHAQHSQTFNTKNSQPLSTGADGVVTSPRVRPTSAVLRRCTTQVRSRKVTVPATPSRQLQLPPAMQRASMAGPVQASRLSITQQAQARNSPRVTGSRVRRASVRAPVDPDEAMVRMEEAKRLQELIDCELAPVAHTSLASARAGPPSPRASPTGAAARHAKAVATGLADSSDSGLVSPGTTKAAGPSCPPRLAGIDGSVFSSDAAAAEAAAGDLQLPIPTAQALASQPGKRASLQLSVPDSCSLSQYMPRPAGSAEAQLHQNQLFGEASTSTAASTDAVRILMSELPPPPPPTPADEKPAMPVEGLGHVAVPVSVAQGVELKPLTVPPPKPVLSPANTPPAPQVGMDKQAPTPPAMSLGQDDRGEAVVVDELPQWWAATNTKYDPTIAALERTAVLSKHRRGASYGSLGASQGQSSLTFQPSLPNPSSDPPGLQSVMDSSNRPSGTPTGTAQLMEVVEEARRNSTLGPRNTPKSFGLSVRPSSSLLASVQVNSEVLAKPSVRYRKTINTIDNDGQEIAVNAQQYSVLVTDVNQHLWTGKPLWPRETHKEGHGWLSFFLPPAMRQFVMHNYAVHASTLYSDSDTESEYEQPLYEEYDEEREDEESEEQERGTSWSHRQRKPWQVNGSAPVNGSTARLAKGSAGPVAESQEGGETSPEQAEVTQDQVEVHIQPSAASLTERKVGKPPALQINADAVLPDEGAALEVDGPPAAGGKSLRVQRSSAENWAFARAAVFEGRVKKLLRSKRYSIVTATFSKLFPDDFRRAIPCINHKAVDLLLFQLDYHMAQYMQAMENLKLRGVRSTRKLGFCGLWGERVDVMDHHKKLIKETQDKLRVARKEAIKSGHTPSWWVFFKTQRTAAICTQTVLHAEDDREFVVRPAPGPEEVNWSALWMTNKQRDLRGWIVKPLLMLLICIPIGIFTGGLMQLDFLFCPTRRCQVDGTDQVLTTTGRCVENTTVVDSANAAIAKDTFQWEWYCQEKNFLATYLSKLITGWLPGLLLTLWQNMVLPLTMLLLVQANGRCFSLSQVDTQVAHYIFWYNLIQPFIGGMLGSALVQQINQLFEAGPTKAFEILGSFIPSSSNFFISYVLFRALVLVPMRMFIPHIGIRMYVFRRWVFRCAIRNALTARERAFLYAPASPRMGFEIAMTLLIVLISMAYAVVAPIMPAIGLGYFIISWVCWRYAALYIYVRKYESGGLVFFPFVYTRLLIIFGMFGLVTACVFVVKKAVVQAILLLVLVPTILLKFNSFIYHRFQTATLQLPLKLAHEAPPAHVPSLTYIPPPLLPKSLGWYPDWGKPWAGWNLPTMYSVS